jgi:IPT/TIG domain
MQPIDLPSLLRAITWPVIVVIAFFVFRRPLGELVLVLGRRAHKFSFGGLSLQLAEVSEAKPLSLDAEIRQLDTGAIPQSGSTGISELIAELQRGQKHDYIVIDLGSESSPRWLTSRLYLLTFLISFLHQPKCLVFVHTVGGVTKRFLGKASPDSVRWGLARKYPWLESASSAAYALVVAGLYCDNNIVSVPPDALVQFDQATGTIQNAQLVQCMQNFLSLIRLPPLPTEAPLGPVITSLSPLGGPVGSSVSIAGVKFGDNKQPTDCVTFNGIPAATTSWGNTEIIATVPVGATSGFVVVTALGLASNAIPFTVGTAGSAEWMCLPNGALEHAKWLDGPGLERLMSGSLDTSHLTLSLNQNVKDVSDSILTQGGMLIAIVDSDKTFRGLVDRSSVLERLAAEVSKQSRSNKL